MWNARLHEAQTGTKTSRRNINKLRYADDTTLMAEGLPCGSAGKEPACNERDLGLTSGLGRFLGEGKGYPLQYSDLENYMDCTVHGGLKESDMIEKLSLHFTYGRKRRGTEEPLDESEKAGLKLNIFLGQSS